jgi:hypothetical protein
MTKNKSQKFSEKHGPQASVDVLAREKIQENAKDGKLPCAIAFKIADEVNKSPAEIGKTTDLMDFRLVKCQLGLFGYTPHKKIVTPKTPDNAKLMDAIQNAVKNERISCRDVWEIAGKFQIPKMTVSAACEALNIKIKPCQLGAF